MKKIGIHLLIVGSIAAILAVGVLWYLDSYTNHGGELVKVENLEGVSVAKAIRLLHSVGLEAVVSDTVYKDGVPKLSIINQNPTAGLEVKKGRKVYLVINTNKIPMVEVPDLAGKTSLPQATNMLIRRHLRVGKVIKTVNASVHTKNDEPVLSQYKSGTTTTITPGSKIERNSSIDLVVGISADYYDTSSDSTSQ